MQITWKLKIKLQMVVILTPILIWMTFPYIFTQYHFGRLWVIGGLGMIVFWSMGWMYLFSEE